MKRSITALIAMVAIAVSAQAQLELPQPSPPAEIEQVVGLTEIEISYSSPAVRDREIFGGLVPYDKLWRTGANKATTISFSRDVEVEGMPLPAGTYSLFTIPGENEWTVIFNKETELWGTGNYDETKDALRVNVIPQDHDEFVERMRILVEDFTNTSARISIEWADVAVPVNVMVNTIEQAYASIKKTTQPSWRVYADAARYAWEQVGDLENAAEWAEASIAVEPTWYNHWILGEVFAATGDTEAALEHMKKALELGNQAENFWYKEKVESNIKKWSANK